MGPILLSLLLSLYAPQSPGVPQDGPGTKYQTKKSLPELQQCLTDRLSKQRDVTAITTEAGTTLMVRLGEEAPMLIDIEPPSVTVTTRFTHGTRSIVEGCL